MFIIASLDLIFHHWAPDRVNIIIIVISVIIGILSLVIKFKDEGFE
jgi:hypothetical protein